MLSGYYSYIFMCYDKAVLINLNPFPHAYTSTADDLWNKYGKRKSCSAIIPLATMFFISIK